MKVFLIGYMASGKSTLGKALAQSLALPFIDLDVEIERTTGTTISEIITAKGELHFRKLESSVLKEATSTIPNGYIRTRRWNSSVLQSHGPDERRRGDHFLGCSCRRIGQTIGRRYKTPAHSKQGGCRRVCGEAPIRASPLLQSGETPHCGTFNKCGRVNSRFKLGKHLQPPVFYIQFYRLLERSAQA